MCSTVTVTEQGPHGILLLLRGEIEDKITHSLLAGPDHLETSFPHIAIFLSSLQRLQLSDDLLGANS